MTVTMSSEDSGKSRASEVIFKLILGQTNDGTVLNKKLIVVVN